MEFVMNEIDEIKKRISKILPIYDNRMAYKAESLCPLLKDCGDDFLINNFSDWLEQPDFLTGLYNILRFDFSSINELKEHLKKIEYIYKFDVSYYKDNSEFYAVKNRAENEWNSCWDNCMISVIPAKYIDKNNLDNYISLDNLKKYEMEHPNQVVWLCILNEADKKTSKWMYKNKLAFKPVKDEKSFL